MIPPQNGSTRETAPEIESDNVIQSNKDHEEDKEDESDLMNIPLDGRAHGRAFNFLNQHEKDAPAVERRNRENIDDAEID